MITKLYKGSYISLFIGILLFYFLITWIFQEFIYTHSVYNNAYSGVLTNQAMEEILGLKSLFWWVGYTLTPIILCFKFLFASICIRIGTIIANVETHFKQIFKAVLTAELVFLIAQVSYVLILFINVSELNLQNMVSFFPLSAISLIGIENVYAHWAIYPLQTANLFEVFYVIAISWLLSKYWRLDFFESANIVIPSYGLGLLLWVSLVAFLTFFVT